RRADTGDQQCGRHPDRDGPQTASLAASAARRSIVVRHLEDVGLGLPRDRTEVRAGRPRRPGWMLARKKAAARRADTIVPGSGRIQSTARGAPHDGIRSEEHTSELQSRGHLVCRLLLEKKKKKK